MNLEKYSGIYSTKPEQPSEPIVLPDKQTIAKIADAAIATLDFDEDLKNELEKAKQKLSQF